MKHLTSLSLRRALYLGTALAATGAVTLPSATAQAWPIISYNWLDGLYTDVACTSSGTALVSAGADVVDAETIEEALDAYAALPSANPAPVVPLDTTCKGGRPVLDFVPLITNVSNNLGLELNMEAVQSWQDMQDIGLIPELESVEYDWRSNGATFWLRTNISNSVYTFVDGTEVTVDHVMVFGNDEQEDGTFVIDQTEAAYQQTKAGSTVSEAVALRNGLCKTKIAITNSSGHIDTEGDAFTRGAAFVAPSLYCVFPTTRGGYQGYSAKALVNFNFLAEAYE